MCFHFQDLEQTKHITSINFTIVLYRKNGRHFIVVFLSNHICLALMFSMVYCLLNCKEGAHCCKKHWEHLWRKLRTWAIFLTLRVVSCTTSLTAITILVFHLLTWGYCYEFHYHWSRYFVVTVINSFLMQAKQVQRSITIMFVTLT